MSLEGSSASSVHEPTLHAGFKPAAGWSNFAPFDFSPVPFRQPVQYATVVRLCWHSLLYMRWQSDWACCSTCVQRNANDWQAGGYTFTAGGGALRAGVGYYCLLALHARCCHQLFTSTLRAAALLRGVLLVDVDGTKHAQQASSVQRSARQRLPGPYMQTCERKHSCLHHYSDLLGIIIAAASCAAPLPLPLPRVHCSAG
jgi:hypothetical protein